MCGLKWEWRRKIKEDFGIRVGDRAGKGKGEEIGSRRKAKEGQRRGEILIFFRSVKFHWFR